RRKGRQGRRRHRRGRSGCRQLHRRHHQGHRQGEKSRPQGGAATAREREGRIAVRRHPGGMTGLPAALGAAGQEPELTGQRGTSKDGGSVPERHSLFETIADQIAPIHADGYKFLALASAVTLVCFLLWPPLGWLAALATAWIAYFFRDPPRVTPLRDGLVIAPADGKICAVERVQPPGELGLGDNERLRISIFLSVFDVHVNRAPVAGRIARSVYVQGSFINAAADKASELNERRAMIIATPDGSDIAVVQIAG